MLSCEKFLIPAQGFLTRVRMKVIACLQWETIPSSICPARILASLAIYSLLLCFYPCSIWTVHIGRFVILQVVGKKFCFSFFLSFSSSSFVSLHIYAFGLLFPFPSFIQHRLRVIFASSFCTNIQPISPRNHLNFASNTIVSIAYTVHDVHRRKYTQYKHTPWPAFHIGNIADPSRLLPMHVVDHEAMEQ